jgi:hypothetical protein
MGDFFRFETMITPIMIQVLFWLAVIVCVIVGIIMLISADEIGARLGKHRTTSA